MKEVTLLRLFQLADSAFPVGSFVHSYGLESYAAMGLDPERIPDLILADLRLGQLHLDLAALVLAFEKSPDLEALQRLNALLTAWKPVRGPREASLQVGKRILALLGRLYPSLPWPPLREGHQAVAWGIAGKMLGLEREPLALAFLHASVQALLMAGTRVLALGPERAQRMLCFLHPFMAKTVQEVLCNPDEALFAATPAWDLRAHQQDFLWTRLFQS
ncbi:urease accessory protein UreF [Thermus islandicus]|uniref:urease accessory protein UreF n=1 Tax=Thermus islandicus TaxID=540988 RepID=UPI0003B3C7ED|nr:urease accessory UreF family protein [Thermus islandicus]